MYFIGIGMVSCISVFAFLAITTSSGLYASTSNQPPILTSTGTTGGSSSSSQQTSKSATPAASATASTSQSTAGSTTKTAPSASTTKTTTPVAGPVGSTVATQSASLRGKALYVDPSRSWQPAAIASQSVATWVGDWSGTPQTATNTAVSAALAQGSMATLVAYDIPGRDCGGYSSGGAGSSDAYASWIRSFAAGIGQRPAIVIVEPDALAQLDSCGLSASQQTARLASIADAVNVLATQTGSYVYIDAGHSGWVSTSTMATRLQGAGVAQATGFSLNVSNFVSTSLNTTYGTSLSAKLGNKHFVIDTGRNGSDVGGQWCNPTGASLGQNPSTNVGGLVDAYLWIKVPGESDGTCNGGPSAGTWYPQYALDLIANR